MSKPDCLRCRGACCEDLVFPAAGLSPATRDFFAVRCGGTVNLTAHHLGFAVGTPCPKLSDDGLCTVYESRPEICRRYEAGGPACVEVLARRRTPEEIAEIYK